MFTRRPNIIRIIDVILAGRINRVRDLMRVCVCVSDHVQLVLLSDFKLSYDLVDLMIDESWFWLTVDSACKVYLYTMKGFWK